DCSVLHYAASIANEFNIGYAKNEACLDYLLGLAFHHSDLLPKLRKFIEGLFIKVFDQVIDFGGVQPKIEAILKECISLRRSDGMCWSLYYLGRVNHELSSELVERIIETEDALAILSL